MKRLDVIEGYDVGGIAGEIAAVGHAARRGVDERLPQRRFPAAVTGAVDGLGIAEVREDSRRRLGDDVSALAHGVSCSAGARICTPVVGDPSWWEVLALASAAHGALRHLR